MKKLIGGALIALSLVVGASAGEGYNIKDSDFGFFHYKMVDNISMWNFQYVYSNDSCLKADPLEVTRIHAEDYVNIYDNGMVVFANSGKVYFKSKDKCLTYAKQKKKFKNIFLISMNYKLRVASGKSCEEVSEKEKVPLLNKIVKKYGKENIIVQFNSPTMAGITLKKGNKQMDYAFFSTKKGCRKYQKIINQLLKEKGQDPYFYEY